MGPAELRCCAATVSPLRVLCCFGLRIQIQRLLGYDYFTGLMFVQCSLCAPLYHPHSLHFGPSSLRTQRSRSMTFWKCCVRSHSISCSETSSCHGRSSR